MMPSDNDTSSRDGGLTFRGAGPCPWTEIRKWRGIADIGVMLNPLPRSYRGTRGVTKRRAFPGRVKGKLVTTPDRSLRR